MSIMYECYYKLKPMEEWVNGINSILKQSRILPLCYRMVFITNDQEKIKKWGRNNSQGTSDYNKETLISYEYLDKDNEYYFIKDNCLAEKPDLISSEVASAENLIGFIYFAYPTLDKKNNKRKASRYNCDRMLEEDEGYSPVLDLTFEYSTDEDEFVKPYAQVVAHMDGLPYFSAKDAYSGKNNFQHICDKATDKQYRDFSIENLAALRDLISSSFSNFESTGKYINFDPGKYMKCCQSKISETLGAELCWD